MGANALALENSLCFNDPMAEIKNQERVYFLDYTKAFVTALVVAQHVAFAYTTYASYYEPNYILSSAPVIDSFRWIGINLFEDFNDKFFMSLMFFIAGFFTFRSASQKGLKKYLWDRTLRLGVPFAIVALTLAPLSYYPAFKAVGGTGSYLNFWFNDFLPLHWLPGPVWFIWVLLSFSFVGGLLVHFFSKPIERGSKKLRNLQETPWRLYFSTIIVSALVYTSVYYFIPGNGPETWFTLAGPLWCQKNRLSLYFLVFCFGLFLGAAEKTGTKAKTSLPGAFESNSKLVRFWPAFLVLALGSHFPMAYIEYSELSEDFKFWIWIPFFITTCISASLALIGFFSQYFHKKQPALQWLAAHAYTVYLIHFPIVIWVQFAFLGLQWHAAAKFLVVTLISWVVSWTVSGWLRRIPVLKQIL